MNDRLQLCYTFPRMVGSSNDNGRLLRVSDATRVLVRSEISRGLDARFPHDLRDEWLTLSLPLDSEGHLPDAKALEVMREQLADPRLGTPFGVQASELRVAYNIHDNVHCSSVLAPVVETEEGTPLTVSAHVTESPGDRPWHFEARIEVELKWEVPLPGILAKP